VGPGRVAVGECLLRLRERLGHAVADGRQRVDVLAVAGGTGELSDLGERLARSPQRSASCTTETKSRQEAAPANASPEVPSMTPGSCVA
jgi:hypothetical protein